MADARGDDVLKEVYAQLDQGGPMNWQYLASQFGLTAETISRLGKRDSPTKALLDTLRGQGVPLEDIAETCRKAGLKTASGMIESCSRRISARADSKPVKVAEGTSTVGKDNAAVSEQWPAKERVYIKCVPYESLRSATENFINKPRSEGGYMVGKGGFGDVFHVKISVKGKPKLECAVKRLIGGESDKEMRKQFEAEVDTMKEFTHPHLMPLYGVSHDGPHLCIVYPFMSGSSLAAAIVEKRKTLVPIVRMTILRDVASALDYLHTKGKTPLVHRDVKSDNILLDDKNVAKLSDFGIVRAFSSTTKDFTKTAPIGTRKYMAPEILRRNMVSPKGDVFALGVVLLELLVNQTIFQRDTVAELEEMDNTTLTCETVERLHLGWTGYQIEMLLNLAEKMIDTYKKRPTAKEVHDVLHQLMRK